MGQNFVPFHDVLIEPTYELSKTLNNLGVSGVFFTDVCFPMAFKNSSNAEIISFIDEYNKQLRNLAIMGHDIQLHIHPHWLHAQIDEMRNVTFNKKYYRLHNYDCLDGDLSINDIIHNGIEYLNNTIKPCKQLYKCIAYRAGGFCLQPEKQILMALYENGIKIDSSVALFHSHNGTDMYYDYSKFDVSSFYVPVSNGFAARSNDAISNSLFEVAIGGYNTPIIKNIISKMNGGYYDSKRGHGMQLQSLSNPTSCISAVTRRLKGILTSPLQMSIDFYNARSLSSMIYCFANKHNYKHSDVFIALVGHPKGMNDFHYSSITALVNEFKKDKQVQFVTMDEICKMKNL